MDPALYYAILSAVGIVVVGGFTYWAGSRLLRINRGGDASSGSREAGAATWTASGRLS